jgi:malonyl-CoA O-methyltransferase
MPLLLQPREAYELWADTYPATAHNPLMEVEQSIVERLLAQVDAHRALDVGTGSGRYLPILAANGARVIGVDMSMAMLARVEEQAEPVAAAKGRRSRPGRRIICADACRLPFRRGTFDLVNASLMVGDIGDLAGWVREVCRVLTQRGHLVYSDFHPSWRQNGWQRTFKDANGVLHAVAYQPHSIDEHLAALAKAGMAVQAIREPRLKIARRDTPVVVVFHATKEFGAGR